MVWSLEKKFLTLAYLCAFYAQTFLFFRFLNVFLYIWCIHLNLVKDKSKYLRLMRTMWILILVHTDMGTLCLSIYHRVSWLWRHEATEKIFK